MARKIDMPSRNSVNIFCFFSIIFTMTLGNPAYSQEMVVLQVQVAKTPVFAEPNPNSKVLGHLSQGTKIPSTGQQLGDFWLIKTRSGRPMWVQASEVTEIGRKLQNDVESKKSYPPNSEKGVDSEEESSHPVTFDIGFSSGSSGGVSYSELNLGINYYFYPWLNWRNAGFYRFSSGDSFFGLDSSFRGIHQMDFLGRGRSVTAFAGVGGRFPSEGEIAPLAEAGVVYSATGLTIGLGMKSIFNEVVDENLENDTQYFIILSGSGRL